MADHSEQDDDLKERPRTPLWEIMVGLVGLVIICVIITFLLIAAFEDKSTPPTFVFTTGSEECQPNASTMTGDVYLVCVRIDNVGGRTAADLQVEARLTAADGSVESSTVEIDYLAPGSLRHVGFYFLGDPDRGQLVFLPRSYQEP